MEVTICQLMKYQQVCVEAKIRYEIVTAAAPLNAWEGVTAADNVGSTAILCFFIVIHNTVNHLCFCAPCMANLYPLLYMPLTKLEKKKKLPVLLIRCQDESG